MRSGGGESEHVRLKVPSSPGLQVQGPERIEQLGAPGLRGLVIRHRRHVPQQQHRRSDGCPAATDISCFRETPIHIYTTILYYDLASCNRTGNQTELPIVFSSLLNIYTTDLLGELVHLHSDKSSNT